MLTFRNIIGMALLLSGVAVLFAFESLGSIFLFLSPDGQVSPFMWLLLKIFLISLGVVGALMLMFPRLLRFAARIDRWIVTTNSRRLLWRALAIAFLLRLLAVAVMPFHLWGDYQCYDDLGRQWADSGAYSIGGHLTAYWPPGYPFWLSRLYLMFGHEPLAGVLANVLLGTATVLLSYLLIRRLWGERIGRWTLLVMAVFPSQVLFTNVLASEMLFTPLFLAAILFFVIGSRTERWWLPVMTGGVILGLATLTRTVTALLLIPITLYWLAEKKNWSGAGFRLVLALTGFLLVTTPWMVRNYHAVGKVCLSTNSGVNLFIGNQPGSGMGYNQQAVEQLDLSDPTQEARVDGQAARQAWDYIAERPMAFVSRGVAKTAYLFATDIDPLDFVLQPAGDNRSRAGWVVLAVVTQSYYVTVLLLAIVALPIILRSKIHRRGPTTLVLSTLGYWTVLHFVFFAVGRFHFPLVPLLAALAVVALAYRIDMVSWGTSAHPKQFLDKRNQEN